jgi:zinc transporter ZupT
MPDGPRPTESAPVHGLEDAGTGGRKVLLGLAPLVLLGTLVAVFVLTDPVSVLRTGFPPVEELTIERVILPEPGVMRVRVVNGGPEPVTVAQVMVDEAYWQHEIEGERTIPRLGRATIELNYPWVEGEPHEIVLVSSTGLTFAHEVEVATRSPRPSTRFLGIFALLGIYVGLVPVLIGLLWYPFLRDVGTRWLHFFLSLTIGLLVFLGADALHEALETASFVPAAFQGVGLVVLGLLGSFLALRALSSVRRGRRSPEAKDDATDRLRLAYLIALGIGLHNLGEGLAIGSAYALGEIALGSFLVIGFAIHNTTEGLAIVAPVAADRPPLWHLLAMGAIAGLPTIAGTWIGGFSYSPIAATLFLAVGAGAILEVVYEIAAMMRRQQPAGLFAPLNATGLALGMLVMYGTALLVVA